jgi:hypothetical protein
MEVHCLISRKMLQLSVVWVFLALVACIITPTLFITTKNYFRIRRAQCDNRFSSKAIVCVAS